MRIKIIQNLIIAAFLLIAFNLLYLQILRGGHFYRQSLGNSIRVIPFEGERGRILDRNGQVIAESEKAYHIVIVPQDLGKKKDVFLFLSDVLGEPAKTIEARYRKGMLTPFSPVSVAEGISRLQAIKVEENIFRFPGLLVLEKYRRKYPLDEVVAHILGYVDKPSPERMRQITQYGYSANQPVGYSGVEERYDELLRGEPGGRQIEVNSRGQQVRLLSLREPTVGQEIMLTIDQGIQGTVTAALSKRRGAGVVLDPDTGEVLALVSSPSYDPNAFSGSAQRDRIADYLQSSASPLLNRAVSAALPPGSVFKIVVAAAALEERKITPGTVYNCPGTFELGGRTFRSPHAWGRQDLTQAMGHSANEYFFHAGLLLGPEQLLRYAKIFGLGERTGIDLPYESKGHIPSPSQRLRWYQGDTVNMSIGQGTILATSLQIARMMAAFTNGGYLVHPRIIQAVGSDPVCKGARNIFALDNNDLCRMPVRISLRKETWEAVRRSLYATVKLADGTAKVLDGLNGIDTFGKTGTAQAGADRDDHAWFAGVSRSAKRKIAYCFLLENGGSSANAVEMVQEIILSLQQKGIL